MSHKDSKLFNWIEKSYIPALDWAFAHKKLTLSLSGGVFIVALFLFFNLGSDFIPQLDEGEIVIGVVGDSRQSIETSTKQQVQIEKLIKEFPEVNHVFSRLGTPESATDPMGPNFADTFVILKKDKSLWPKTNNGKHRSKSELYQAIEKTLSEKFPKHEFSSTQPIEMRFNEILEGSRADVTMRVYGPDLEKLLEYITMARDKFQALEGVSSVEFDALTGLTKSEVIEAKVSPIKAMEYGLEFDSVSRQISKSLSGEELGFFFFDENVRLPIMFHLDESLRNDLESMQNMPIALPDSGSIPLKNLAEIIRDEQVTTISRSWAERYSAISFYIEGRDIASVVKDAQKIMKEQVPLDPGYRIEWGGQFKNLERAQAKLQVIVPLTLLLILFIIYKMTGSMLQSSVIFLAIPLGLVGGVFALYLRGMNFSISAAVGFIALSGIVVLNSLVLVSFINTRLQELTDSLEAIKEGAVSRLRPVVMTAMVASLGFLPMALGNGMGAEVQKPLATVVIGGLITSTLLTMLVVPIILKLTLPKK